MEREPSELSIFLQKSLQASGRCREVYCVMQDCTVPSDLYSSAQAGEHSEDKS